jgi:hypothetical protein
MADQKISQLTSATLPLAGTEVLPLVQAGSTKKVATDDLTVKNVRSNATSGILQVTGPAAAATRVMTVPDANFTAARADAAQTLTGDQTISSGNFVVGTSGRGATTSGAFDLGLGTNGSTSQAYVTQNGSLLANTATANDSANGACFGVEGGSALTRSWSGSGNTTINTILGNTGLGGGLCIIRGFDGSTGNAFVRVYAVAVQIAGGAGGVNATLVSSAGGSAAFTFALSGSNVQVTAASTNGGGWFVCFIV